MHFEVGVARRIFGPRSTIQFEGQALCRVHGIKQSMGSVGDCYDNAQAESWFATLKRESVLKTDRLK